MSYELSGYEETSPAPRRKFYKLKSSKLSKPLSASARLSTRPGSAPWKRRARPMEMLHTMPRLPRWAAQPSQLSGLGFSLKPPKWVRKLTIKKALKPLAIGAAIVGSAFIPGALPLLGKGVGLFAKGAVGAGKFLGKRFAVPIATGFMSKFRKPAAVQGAQTQAEYDAQVAAEQAAANQAAQNAANQWAADQAAANQAAAQASAVSPQFTPPTYTPSGGGGASYGGGGASYGGGGGGGAAPPGAETTAQTPASAGLATSSLIPIGIGLVALVAVSGVLNRGRR